MIKNIPTLGILATPYINNKDERLQELILDKTLLRLLAKKNINYIHIPYTINKPNLNR